MSNSPHEAAFKTLYDTALKLIEAVDQDERTARGAITHKSVNKGTK